MRVGRTSVQRALAVRKEGCRPRGRPTYVPVRVSGQMPVSSFRVRGGQQGVPSWEEGGGSAGSGVLVRGAPGTESQVRAATQHPRLCLQGSCRRGRGLRGEGVACARPGTAPPRRWLSPCAFGGLHGVQEAGQGGVGSPPSRKSAPWGRGFPQPGVSCWPGGGARTMGPVGAAPWLSGLPLETPELRSLSVCRVLRGGARSPWNSWLFYCIGKETLKACKTALLCPCHGDGAGGSDTGLGCRWEPLRARRSRVRAGHAHAGRAGRRGYSMPLRRIWLAAISMTLMMKAMAKAQMRLLRTHVCLFCFWECTGGRGERREGHGETGQPPPPQAHFLGGRPGAPTIPSGTGPPDWTWPLLANGTKWRHFCHRKPRRAVRFRGSDKPPDTVELRGLSE